MDLQEMLDNYIKAVRQNKLIDSPQMKLGQLIEEIEKIGTKDGDKDKTVEYDFGTAIPTTLDSWRGSYAELALGYELTGYDTDKNHHGQITAEHLLKNLKDALNPEKSFYGWKGGDYYMDKDTPVWVANPGNSGNTGIVGVMDDGWRIILLTAYCEY